jgi:hypothetical protein
VKSVHPRRIASLSRLVGFDGAACIGILALVSWSSFEIVARDLEIRWPAQLKLLYCAGPLALNLVLAGMLILFFRENRETRNHRSRARLALVLLGIAIYFAVTTGASSESPLWWLLSGKEPVSFYLSQSGFVLLLLLFSLFLGLYLALLSLVISTWRRPTGVVGHGKRTVLFALLAGLACYFASGSYLMEVYGANYVEIHCHDHVPCK